MLTPTDDDRAPGSPGFGWIDVPPGKLGSWSLVLDSQAIPHRIGQGPAGYGLVVHRAHLAAARSALEAFEWENPQDAAETTPADNLGRPAFGLAAALVLLAAFLLVPPNSAPDSVFGRGVAHASAIRHGELWRTVTALTLHADLVHLISNFVALGLLGAVLAAVAGEGTAAVLLVLSGAAGNGLNAIIQPGWHQSVGASTSVFGAIGGLVGIRLRQIAAGSGKGYPLWAPLLAGLLLLALFGANPHTDVSAHVLGFGAGLLSGALVGQRKTRLAGRRAQAGLLVGALTVVAGAWWGALRGPDMP